MNYRLAFVFSYEHFENAIICIICFGSSTRFRPILNIPVFRKNGASLDLLNNVFENSLPKGFFFGELKKFKNFSSGAGFSMFTENGSYISAFACY